MSLLRMWGAHEGIAPAAIARLEALLGIAGAMRRQEYPVCLPADEARRFDNFAQLVTAAANMRSAHHKL